MKKYSLHFGRKLLNNSFLIRIFVSVIFLIIFLNGFVFIEPAPAEYLLTFSIPLFLILGKIKIKPLFIFLFLSFINLFSFLVTANLASVINARFLVINLYMFLTFFLFSTIDAREIGTFLDKFFVFWTASIFVNLFFYFVGILISRNILFGVAVINFGIRFQGFFKDPNVLGPFIVPPLIYWINKFLIKRSFKRLLVILFLSLSLLLTFSRGAYLNFLISFLFNIYLNKKLYPKIRFKNVLLIGVVLAFMLFLILKLNIVILGFSLRNFAIQRFVVMQSYDIDRFKAQKSVINLIKESPLFGIGIGNYNNIVNYAAHNSYVRILGETGIIGFLFSMLILVFILYDRFRTLRGSNGNIAAVLYSSLIGVLGESFFVDTLHWRFFWIILGLLYAI